MFNRRPLAVSALVVANITFMSSCTDDSVRSPTVPAVRTMVSAADGDSLAPLYEMSNPRRIPGRYIVRFKSTSQNVRELTAALTSQHGGRAYEILAGLGGFWGELPDNAISGLRRNPNVAYIEADV
jgi:hypothetical protein